MNDTYRQSLLGAALDALRSAPGPVAISMLFLTGAYGAIDLFVPIHSAASAQFVPGLLAIYLQLLVTAHLLVALSMQGYVLDRASPTRGRFPAAFGLLLLWYCGVLAGLILLFVPGLFLMVRWSLVIPVMIAEDASITESFRRSWSLTRESWKDCIRAYLMSLPLLAAGVIAYIFYPEYEEPSLLLVALANLTTSAAMVLFWALIAVVYARARWHEDPSADFA